jgi:hypothetical protein
MPAYTNGTFVSINIEARDGANNVYTHNATWDNFEYNVLGSWIEIIPQLPTFNHGADQNIIINISLRGDLNVTIDIRYYNPIFEYYSGAFGNTTYSGFLMSQLNSDQYNFTIPAANITYYHHIYINFHVLNGTNYLNFVYNGQSGTETGFIFYGEVIDTLAHQGINQSSLVSATPGEITSSDDIEIHFTLFDELPGASDTRSIILRYRVDGGSWVNTTPIFYDGEYIGIIPKQAGGSTVEYQVIISDIAGNTYTSTLYSYAVVPDPFPFIIVFLITLIIGLVIVVWIGKGIASSEKKKLTGKERYKMIKRKL